jgi:hypothetical protein
MGGPLIRTQARMPDGISLLRITLLSRRAACFRHGNHHEGWQYSDFGSGASVVGIGHDAVMAGRFLYLPCALCFGSSSAVAAMSSSEKPRS